MLFLEDLNQLECSTHGGNCACMDDEPFRLSCGLHPDAGSLAQYEAGSGQLCVRCAACKIPSVLLALARRAEKTDETAAFGLDELETHVRSIRGSVLSLVCGEHRDAELTVLYKKDVDSVLLICKSCKKAVAWIAVAKRDETE